MRPALLALPALLLLAAHPVSDLNRDGEISLGEYITRVDALFAKADTDFDGRLGPDEEKSLDRIFSDANAMDRFRIADVDGNGQLDEREWMSTVVTPMESVGALYGGLHDLMQNVDYQNFDQESWEAGLLRLRERTEHNMARARVITNMPEEPELPEASVQTNPSDAAGSRSLITATDQPVEGDVEIFGMEVQRLETGGRTAQEYRMQMVFNFLMKDADDNDVLTLDEWQKLGLFSQ